MNRTYIFDVIDRHSVKSIELYEFQVFLRLRLWLTASCPIRRRAVVLDVLKFLANRCISCGLGQVRIRRGVRSPWNRPNEIQGWFCLITWQHWFWRVNLMRIMMWRPGSVEFKPPVILLATCKVKLDDFKVGFRMPGRAGFGSWVCLRMSWAGVSVPQNSQLGSSQWEQSHLKIYDTPFHPQVHHHFPIFSHIFPVKLLIFGYPMISHIIRHTWSTQFFFWDHIRSSIESGSAQARWTVMGCQHGFH